MKISELSGREDPKLIEARAMDRTDHHSDLTGCWLALPKTAVVEGLVKMPSLCMPKCKAKVLNETGRQEDISRLPCSPSTWAACCGRHAADYS